VLTKRTVIAFLLGWGVLGFFFTPRDLVGLFKGRNAT
jgi:hypothetical protein